MALSTIASGRAAAAIAALGLTLACAACGRAPSEPRTPTEYVRANEWQSPPAAKRAEAEIDEAPKQPAGPVDLPPLKRHQGIAKDRAYRLARPARAQ